MKSEQVIAVILIVVFCGLIYWLYTIFAKQDEETEIPLLDCRALQQDVADLHKMMQRLEELDSAIVELRLCKPAENMRSFRIEWQSISGAAHMVDFTADGESESHESFMEWAVNERVRLNQEIAQRIYDLYSKAEFLDCSPTYESTSGEWSEPSEKVDGDRFLNENSAGEW